MPMTIASAIAAHDSTIVMTEARNNAGRYATIGLGPLCVLCVLCVLCGSVLFSKLAKKGA
jgi:hypothetical protein